MYYANASTVCAVHFGTLFDGDMNICSLATRKHRVDSTLPVAQHATCRGVFLFRAQGTSKCVRTERIFVSGDERHDDDDGLVCCFGIRNVCIEAYEAYGRVPLRWQWCWWWWRHKSRVTSCVRMCERALCELYGRHLNHHLYADKRATHIKTNWKPNPIERPPQTWVCAYIKYKRSTCICVKQHHQQQQVTDTRSSADGWSLCARTSHVRSICMCRRYAPARHKERHHLNVSRCPVRWHMYTTLGHVRWLNFGNEHVVLCLHSIESTLYVLILCSYVRFCVHGKTYDFINCSRERISHTW